MGGRGVTVGLRYIQRFTDRHGRERFYFRRPGRARVALPGAPGSPEFMAAYTAALADDTPVPRAPAAAAGTFDRLIAEYLRSPGFLRTKPASQSVTRGILHRFAARHGHRLVADMETRHVMAVVGALAATPAAANNLLKKLRVLIRFARKTGYRSDDPTGPVELFRGGAHHTWTDAELALFESRWPLGSRQRTAFAMAIFTGQRRSDLVAMAWSDYDARGAIAVTQVKTGAKLSIPAHRDLRAALEAWPRRHVTILATEGGRGTSVAGFGNFMADAIAAAGLPERCVLHGLRKAASRRLAEAGCTANQIAAITGHRSLKEVERYTAAADQKTLAKAAIRKLELSNRPRRV